MEALKRILHVDDDSDIRIITKMTLELVGHYDVVQFASGEETLQAAEAPPPQLLLLDVMMPGMSGENLWHKLNALPGWEDVPVIFMTAKTEQAFARHLIEAGALEVILKPFEPIDLCRQIEAVWVRHHETGAGPTERNGTRA